MKCRGSVGASARGEGELEARVVPAFEVVREPARLGMQDLGLALWEFQGAVLNKDIPQKQKGPAVC